MNPDLLNALWFLCGAGCSFVWRWPWFTPGAQDGKIYVVLYRYDGDDVDRIVMRRTQDDALRFAGKLATEKDKPAKCEIKVADLI